MTRYTAHTAHTAHTRAIHCGAGDCETCLSGGAAEMRAEEAREEGEAEHLDPLKDEMTALNVTITAAHELHLDTTALEDFRYDLGCLIDAQECDGPDFEEDGNDFREPDYDEPDYGRVTDSYEAGIYG